MFAGVSCPAISSPEAMLTRPMPGLPADLARRLPDRFFDVMFDGLRAGSRTPLSGAPIARWWT
jgi:hypothetical protein